MDLLESKIELLEKKMDELQSSIDRLRKIFFWFIVISVALVILPLIGLSLVIPQFLSTYSSVLQ